MSWKEQLTSAFDEYLNHVSNHGAVVKSVLAGEEDEEKANERVARFFKQIMQKISASLPTPLMKIQLAGDCLDSLQSGESITPELSLGLEAILTKCTEIE